MHLLIVLMGACFGLSEPSESEPSAVARLEVQNRTNFASEVWIWPKSVGAYVRPETFLRPNSTGKIQYSAGESYWIVARQNGREYPVGWVNISELAESNPNIVLDLAYVYETRTHEYRVWDWMSRRWVTRTRTETVGKLVIDFRDAKVLERQQRDWNPARSAN